MTETRITRDDLERKFRAVQDDLQGKVDRKRPTIAAMAGGTALVLIVIFFLLGRRSGKKRTTLVEIRRV